MKLTLNPICSQCKSIVWTLKTGGIKFLTTFTWKNSHSTAEGRGEVIWLLLGLKTVGTWNLPLMMSEHWDIQMEKNISKMYIKNTQHLFLSQTFYCEATFMSHSFGVFCLLISQKGTMHKGSCRVVQAKKIWSYCSNKDIKLFTANDYSHRVQKLRKAKIPELQKFRADWASKLFSCILSL